MDHVRNLSRRSPSIFPPPHLIIRVMCTCGGGRRPGIEARRHYGGTFVNSNQLRGNLFLQEALRSLANCTTEKKDNSLQK